MTKQQNKSILVTGAAGFIGTEVCIQLAQKGRHVIALDNFDDYYPVSLKKERWDSLNDFSSIIKVVGDIRQKELLNGLFSKHSIQAVVNLAGMAGVRNSISNPEKYFDVNAIGTLRVLEVMKKYGVKKIVQASTSSLYAGLPMPFVEHADVRKPISPYAASKLAAESLLYTYSELHGFESTVLRYFTVYGPSGRPDMAPYRFAEWIRNGEAIQLFGDGNQTRDFTYVSDIARGTVLAAVSQLPRYEIINLGGGEKPVSINAFIAAISEKMNKPARVDFLPSVAADMLHTSANIEKAKRVLGWKPEVTLQEGIAKLVSWHEKFNA